MHVELHAHLFGCPNAPVRHRLTKTIVTTEMDTAPLLRSAMGTLRYRDPPTGNFHSRPS
jgi:hypothetical protein